MNEVHLLLKTCFPGEIFRTSHIGPVLIPEFVSLKVHKEFLGHRLLIGPFFLPGNLILKIIRSKIIFGLDEEVPSNSPPQTTEFIPLDF